ncbi:MAG: PDDEXK nuclease domain-containing protein [Elusimicrobia bacterium]|nr:PDDEXK nuclease domain-containing protein [Candidatus Obscuribacterium magneticum]
MVRTVSEAIRRARSHAATAVNSSMTLLYWGIGRQIVEFDKGGKRAVYGQSLLKAMAEKLEGEFGRGYSWRNLYMMCQFYEAVRDPKILQTLSAKLAWSKLCQIVSFEEPEKRHFYLKLCANEGWSVRELKRQIRSALYERTPLGKRNKALHRGFGHPTDIDQPGDVIKDPYIFEFLGLPDRCYSENELERALINRLQDFITELGKGFCFEARQKRIDLDGVSSHVDLVFYHRILKSTVLIDLKIGEFTHQYAGQMNYYLNWWKDNEMGPGDQPPVGIILCASKKDSDAHVEYAIGGLTNRIFVSRYRTYLPSKTQLQHLLTVTQDRWEKEHGKLPSGGINQTNAGESN